jgi:hypothetical protein
MRRLDGSAGPTGRGGADGGPGGRRLACQRTQIADAHGGPSVTMEMMYEILAFSNTKTSACVNTFLGFPLKSYF